MPIWVETTIRAPLEEVWRRTQDPTLHAAWDLRFSTIDYLPRSSPDAPQRFLYRTRIGMGMSIAGEGESTGEGDDATGVRTSALRFWSRDPRSLIAAGSGFWQYTPTEEGTRFVTVYDYSPRGGALGRVVDTLAFRPLLAWATAWSFDRLRLWCERSLPPAAAARGAAAHAIARLALALVWIYQGLVPKLLFPASGELELARHTVGEHAGLAVAAVGAAELAFGMALLVFWRSAVLPALAVPALVVLLLAGAVSDPSILTTPFNAPSLTVATAGLAAVTALAVRDLPSAASCRWSSRKRRR